MKNILIATDLKEGSASLVNYGASLAKSIDANIVLFHAYNLPIGLMEAQVVMMTAETLEQEVNAKLKTMCDEIKKFMPAHLSVSSDCTLGMAGDSICDSAIMKNADIILMGREPSERLEDKIMGSITAYVIRSAKVPVLVIPPHASFKPMVNIVLACSKSELISDSVYKTVKHFINAFHGRLHILDIVRSGVSEMEHALRESSAISARLESLIPSVHIPENESVVEGINHFIDEYHADLLIMLPEKHNFFERLFVEIHTKKVALHNTIPLLTIPAE